MATKRKTYEDELARTEQELAGLNYQKSDQVTAAEQALADYTAQKPAAYQSSYQARLDDLMEQILDRGGLEYSFDADPLYQQYKDGYTRAARLALQDTTAQAAALTGGYGSSYAASAGSQAYQEQMAHLDDALPTLYGLALDRWNSETGALYDRLDALAGLEQDARSAYQDELENYYTGLEAVTSAADAAYTEDYKAYEARRQALTDLRDYYAGQNQQAEKNAQAEAEYQLAVQKYEESVRQWEAEQAAAREKWQTQLAWDKEQFEREMAAQAAKTAATLAKASSSSSSSTSSSKSSSKSSSSTQSGSKTAAGSAAGTLSAAALQVQRQVYQRANALTSRVGGGVSQAALTRQLTTLLQSYCDAGTITKAEANVIGERYGVTL